MFRNSILHCPRAASQSARNKDEDSIAEDDRRKPRRGCTSRNAEKKEPTPDFSSQKIRIVAYTALRERYVRRIGIFLTVAMATASSRKRVSEPSAIPDRLYFKIGDVARICGVETYVLRFWETEFPQLKPNKSGTGQRLYRRGDVELALEIKRLVHAEGYTLSGARQALDQRRQRKPQPSSSAAAGDAGKNLETVAAAVGRARAELKEIAGMLASPVAAPRRRRTRMTPVPSSSGMLFPS